MTRGDLLGLLICLFVGLIVAAISSRFDGEQSCVPRPSAVKDFFLPECMARETVSSAP